MNTDKPAHLKSMHLARLTVGIFIVLLASAQGTDALRAIRWGDAVLKQPSEWYGSAEARALADSVIQYQSPQGGWPKSTDLATPPRAPDDIPPPGRGRANSLDNDATTLPMAFLARVAYATGEAKYRDSFLRGVEYLLAAQYSNGGWPQFWPLRDGYYSRITYNDDAMIRAMTILRDVADGQPPHDFVDGPRRGRAAEAVARGIDCILKTQIRQDGKLTAWCAQHDEKTLKPAWARAYEPPSLSGSESVDIVRFLISVEEPTPEIIAAVEGATAWFRSVAIQGWRVEESTNSEGEVDRQLVADADAPDILPKLRVYWIGGPNKKWSPDAFQYIATHHPKLWIIEANATYRGWFVGGSQYGQWGIWNSSDNTLPVTGHSVISLSAKRTISRWVTRHRLDGCSRVLPKIHRSLAGAGGRRGYNAMRQYRAA